MRRRLVPVLVAGLLAAGCGVPADSGVRVDGPPPEAGPLAPGRADPPPGPDDADDEQELVDNFLRAAIDPDVAVDELRGFIHSSQRDEWQPDPKVYLARVAEPVVTPGDPVQFDLTVQRVGQLTDDGVIEPRAGRETETLGISVAVDRSPSGDEVGAGTERYRILDPPPYVLLDDRALEDHFQERAVYFWDNEEAKLVPDLRWLPRALPDTQRPTTVVDWLIAGPSSWLSGSVSGVPEGVVRNGNVVPGDRSLEVALTAPHDEVDLDKLEAQLWWTLYPDLGDGTELTLLVNDEERAIGEEYGSSNLAAADPPASFAVLEGVVRQYAPETPVSLPSLDDGSYSDIRRAAVSRSGRLAALVREEPTGEELRLTVADARSATETDLVADDLGRPVWLNNPTRVGLVPADGKLHQFATGEDGASVAEVEVTGLAGGITAVAAAPDGRRIALVAGGRLYMASMVRAGDVVSVDVPRELPTTATDLDGVAFIREDWLAVVGSDEGRSRLFELTVDGALERELPNGDLGAPDEVDNLVGYPPDPTGREPDRRGTLMFEADGRTYRYAYPQEAAFLRPTDLLGVESAPDDEAEEANPRAPFFLD